MDQSSVTRPRRWGESPMFKAETKRETLGGVSYFEMRLRKHKSQRQGENNIRGIQYPIIDTKRRNAMGGYMVYITVTRTSIILSSVGGGE